jgi:hypothetical protein
MGALTSGFLILEGDFYYIRKMANYDVSIPAVNQHLKRIYSDNKLTRGATIKKYLIVQTEGTRQGGAAGGIFYREKAIVVSPVAGMGYLLAVLQSFSVLMFIFPLK